MPDKLLTKDPSAHLLTVLLLLSSSAVEQVTVNHLVAGSIPASDSTTFFVAVLGQEGLLTRADDLRQDGEHQLRIRPIGRDQLVGHVGTNLRAT